MLSREHRIVYSRLIRITHPPNSLLILTVHLSFPSLPNNQLFSASDAALSVISRLPNLETLVLTRSCITAAGASHLNGAKNLKTLVLVGARHLEMNADFRSLQLTTLKAQCKIHLQLFNLGCIEELELRNSALKTLEAVLPKLRSLQVDIENDQPSLFRSMQYFPSLETMTLRWKANSISVSRHQNISNGH